MTEKSIMSWNEYKTKCKSNNDNYPSYFNYRKYVKGWYIECKIDVPLKWY